MKLDNNKQMKQIDLGIIFNLLKRHRKLYYIVLPITFALSCLYILCIPRTYQSTVKLAPELTSLTSSSLSDLASSFGFDIGNNTQNTDAIFPELYPDLIASTDFQTNLFNIKVKTKDGKVNTTYYNYLLYYQKAPFWTLWIYKVKSVFTTEREDYGHDVGSGTVNPFMLTKIQNDIASAIGNKIKCQVDKKNYVISITVEDQDPLVCANMADTVRLRLQQVITDYRTNKAKHDYLYFKKICDEAKSKYEKARQQYGAFSDANQDVVLQSVKSKQEDLENNMQLLYNRYSALASQAEQARARIQERTPVFTTLQNASVPIKASGPKRMVFVLSMTFVAFVLISLYAVRELIFVEDNEHYSEKY